jgi:hypothetical protein
MATIRLPPDFREFLQLLNSHQIEYLVIGGYAIGFHGHPRATGDMDVWIAIDPDNARKIIDALRAFGFTSAPLSVEMFLKEKQVFRMGMPPLRIELLTTISGVEFADCYARRSVSTLDGLDVNFINIEDLKRNKAASGRPKDKADLEQLK